MKRAYKAPPDMFRCTADIVLEDGSTARCQRGRARSPRLMLYCRQHQKIIDKRKAAKND